MFENCCADINAARRGNVRGNWWAQHVKVYLQLGTLAVINHRFHHWVLTRRNAFLLAFLLIPAVIFRALTQFLTGVHISPKAEIGPGLVVHTIYGIFIGARKIGSNCFLQTGVVVQYGRRPIGDNVYFGAGAKVVGSAAIGSNVHVGPNSLILTDVPDNMSVFGVPARIRLPLSRSLWYERERSNNGDGQDAATPASKFLQE